MTILLIERINRLWVLLERINVVQASEKIDFTQINEWTSDNKNFNGAETKIDYKYNR